MKIAVISQRADEIKEYGEVRDALDEAWQQLFLQMNTALAPVPNELRSAREILKRLIPDAIVLSGGNSPISYGGTAPQRDQTDELLIQYAIEHDTPLLGVCRGMQSIALYFGGTLKKVEGHVAVYHEIAGETARKVNSYHSFAVDFPGKNVRIASRAKDGTIEAIYHENYQIYGMMWHPERVAGFSKEDIELIKDKLKL